MNYTTSIIPLTVIDVVEDDARRLLKPAIDTSDGRFSEDTVMTAIKSGFYQLWMVFDEDNRPAAAFVTGRGVSAQDDAEFIVLRWRRPRRMA